MTAALQTTEIATPEEKALREKPEAPAPIHPQDDNKPVDNTLHQ